jgi:hypothetical protein
MQYSTNLAFDLSRINTGSYGRNDFSPRSDAGSLNSAFSPRGVQNQRGLGIVFQRPNMSTGLLVQQVRPNGAAAISGQIKPGDVVLTIDGRQVYAGMTGDSLSEIVQVRNMPFRPYVSLRRFFLLNLCGAISR